MVMIFPVRRSAWRRHCGVVSRWYQLIGYWAGRYRQRRALARLDDRLLADIGISREAARQEAGKPFWR